MSDWKQKAIDQLKLYYQSFKGSQWDQYDEREDKKLLLAKICFAIFGPPTIYSRDDDLSKGYKKDQREKAQEILDLIVSVSVKLT